MDECPELASRFSAQFPGARAREGFTEQGDYTGLAKACKCFLLSIHLMDDDWNQCVYKSGSKLCCVPKRTLLYEIFAELDVTAIVPGRTCSRFCVQNARAKAKLKDRNLENQMKEGHSSGDSSTDFLSSIAQTTGSVLLALEKPQRESTQPDPEDEARLLSTSPMFAST